MLERTTRTCRIYKSNTLVVDDLATQEVRAPGGNVINLFVLEYSTAGLEWLNKEQISGANRAMLSRSLKVEKERVNIMEFSVQ